MILVLFACAPKSVNLVTERPVDVAPAAALPRPDELGPGEFMLLHTNDLHGHFVPEPADWLPGEPAIGGIAALDAWTDAIEERLGADGILLVDAGDLLTGTPLTDLEVNGARGGAMLELMEAVGYDAVVLGNHEFDHGFDNLAALIAGTALPVLSANVQSPEGGLAFEGQLASLVVVRNGVRIGLIGATTEGLGHLVSAADWERLQLEAVSDAVAREAERLDPDTDLLVAVTHIGLDADRALARAVPSLDVIIGGHSHTPLSEAEVVGDTVIVQAGSHGRQLGHLRLRVVDDELAAWHYTLHDLVPESQPASPSPEVVALVEAYTERIDAEYGEVIGEAITTLTRRYDGESTLGNWITDVLREATGSEIGLYNSGGLRADLRKGPLTLRSVYEVFPFGNAVVTFELSGADLVAVLLANAAVDGGYDGGMTPMSGVETRWKRHLGAPELVSITVGGEALQPDRLYTVATNSYVAEQSDRYLQGAAVLDLQPLGRTVFDVAVEAVRSAPVEGPALGRLSRI